MALIDTTRSRVFTVSGNFTIPNVTLQVPVIDGLFSYICSANITGIGGFNVVIGGQFGNATVWLQSCSVGSCGLSDGTNTPIPLGGFTGSYSISVEVGESSDYTSGLTRTAEWDLYDVPKLGGAVSGTLDVGGDTFSFSGVIGPSFTTPIPLRGGHTCFMELAFTASGQVLTPSTLAGSLTCNALGQSLQWPFTQIYTAPVATVDLTGGISISGMPRLGGGVGVRFQMQPTKQGTITGQINAFDAAYVPAVVTEWAAPDGPRNPSTGLPIWTPFNFGDTISLENARATVTGYSWNNGFVGSTTPPPPNIDGTSFERQDGNGLMARINPQSLASFNEKAALPWDLALNARLRPFNALTLWQDASYVLDPCTSVVQWSANVTLVGGFLQVNSGSLSGVATKTWTVAGVPKNTEGYRYLEIDIQPNTAGTAWTALTGYLVNDFVVNGGNLYKCTVAGTSAASGGPTGTGGAIVDGSVTWSYQSIWQIICEIRGEGGTLGFIQYKHALGATGALTTIRFDLMAPYSATNPGFIPTLFKSGVRDCKALSTGTPSEGPGWGIDGFRSMLLDFPANSGTYQIHQIRMVRDSDSRVTFLQSDQTQVNVTLGQPGYGGFNYYEFGLGDTDGKRSFGQWDVTTSNQPTILSAGVNTFSDRINKINGWHATPNASLLDLSSWYGSSWLLSNLCGAGAIYTGSAPSVYWIDRALTTNPTQLQYQARAAVVYFQPKSGDIVNAGGFGTPFRYYTLEFLKQRTTGVAIDINQNPITSTLVTEKETVSGTSSGTGTTNAKGRFITGTPFAKTNLLQKDVLAGVESVSGTIAFTPQNRSTLRLAYLANPVLAAGQAWHIQDEWSRVHQSVVTAGDVWYRRASFPFPAPAWLFYNQVTSYGDVKTARMCYAPIDGRVYLFIGRLTAGVYSTYVCYSQSHGQDWSTPALYMANALGATPVIDHDGYFVVTFFKYNAGTSGPGTQWITKGLNPTSLPAPYQMVDSTNTAIQVADGGWSNVQPGSTNQNPLTWSPTINGETDPSLWYSIDADRKTWQRF